MLYPTQSIRTDTAPTSVRLIMGVAILIDGVSAVDTTYRSRIDKGRIKVNEVRQVLLVATVHACHACNIKIQQIQTSKLAA